MIDHVNCAGYSNNWRVVDRVAGIMLVIFVVTAVSALVLLEALK